MVERATCAASRNEGYQAGVEAVASVAGRIVAPDRWFERLTIVNHLVAGWALLLLALGLNLLDLNTGLGFLGVVSSGLALFCVWCGMLAKSIAMRAAWFVWNATAIVIAYVAWLFNHRDLWGIFRNVLS